MCVCATLQVTKPVGCANGNWLIPIDVQSDLRRVHLKAGFTRDGE